MARIQSGTALWGVSVGMVSVSAPLSQPCLVWHTHRCHTGFAKGTVNYSHYGMEPGNPEVLGMRIDLGDRVVAFSVLEGVSCSRQYKPD